MLNSMKLSSRSIRAGAALDHPAQAAGLPVQVEAQRQPVQVAEDRQRDLANRMLADPREDGVAQLGKGEAGDSRRAIGQDRHNRQRPRPGWYPLGGGTGQSTGVLVKEADM